MPNTKTPRFAAGTTVSQSSTVQQIDMLLEDYGATGFAYAKQGRVQLIAFELSGRQVRMTLDVPLVNDPDIRETAARLARANKIAVPKTPAAAYDMITKQRWRALYLVLKAKLVAIAEGIRTLEQEFGWNIVLPNGQTIGDALAPHVDRAYATGVLPQILPGMPVGPLPELPPPVDWDDADAEP